MIITQSASSSNKKKYDINSVDTFKVVDFRWPDVINAFDRYLENCANSKSNNQNLYDMKDVTNSNFGLELLDRVGRKNQITLSSGHICTISDESSTNAALNIEIINNLLSANKPFEIIKGSDFNKLSDEEKSTTEIQYLIQVNVNRISYLELQEIIGFTKTQFIFKIPGLMLNLQSEYEDKERLSLLLHAFSLDQNLMKYLVASLSNEEFVVVSEGTMSVRSLTSEE